MQNVILNPTQLMKLQMDISQVITEELKTILPGMLAKELETIVSDKVEEALDTPMDMKRAAIWLGVKYDTFKHWVADDKKAIPFHKDGKGKKIFSRKELNEYYLGKTPCINIK